VPGLFGLLLSGFVVVLSPGLFVLLSLGLLSGLFGSLTPGLSSGFASDFFFIQSTLAIAVPLFPALSTNSKVNSPFLVKL